MSKRRREDAPSAVSRFLDFSSLKQPASRIILEAGNIASDLIENDVFFRGTVAEVLKKIAEAAQLACPTEAEVEQVREQLKCQVSCLQMDDAYMQCSMDTPEIAINEQVKTLQLECQICVV
jgi:hypothetical protein